VRPPTLSAGPDDRLNEAGVTVLEAVCVIAVLALVALVTLPGLPAGTSRARLESYAAATASLLKSDRNAALRRQTVIETEINISSRFVRSGATGRIVNLPDDVALDALLTARCSGYPQSSLIRFFPNGTSCGGALSLSRSGASYQVRVNWLTGGIEVVAVTRT